MSVYRKLREKTAASVSEIEIVESFNWNKWLKVPEVDYETIGQITSRLDNVDDINVWLTEARARTFDFDFSKVKLYKTSQRIFVFKTKTNRVFFGFGDTNFKKFKDEVRLKSSIEFSLELFAKQAGLYIRIKKGKNDSKLFKLNASIYDFDMHSVPAGNDDIANFSQLIHFENVEQNSITDVLKLYGLHSPQINFYDFNISLPKSIDYLSTLYPEVYDVKLLNWEVSASDELDESSSLIKIDLLDNLPGTNNINLGTDSPIKVNGEIFDKEIVLNNGKSLTTKGTSKFEMSVRLLNENIINSIKKAKTARVKFPSMNSKIKQVTEQVVFGNENVENEAIDVDELGRELQPDFEVTEEEKNKLFENLFPYQTAAAEFLYENPRALLFDEPGLGKELEVLSALRYLFRKREIRKVLLVVPNHYTGSKVDEAVGGWLGTFKIHSNELSFKAHPQTKDLGKELRKPVNIHVINFDTLNFLIENLNESFQKYRFDCVIFDELQIIQKSQRSIHNFLEKSSFYYIWYLTSIEPELFYHKLSHLNLPKKNYGKTRIDCNEYLPAIKRENIWFDLDKAQEQEYEQAFFHGQNEITEILQTGNPYRLQAKVLFVLHQLNQIYNFASEKETSAKLKLLLFHLETIISNRRKVIIFSQYDKNGCQKIIKFLDKYEIRYLSYAPGLSADKVKQIEHHFVYDDSISVLVADSHVNGLNLQNLKADYIIHFDKWWIPQNQWQLEDRILSAKLNKSRPIVSYSYLTKSTVEEQIYDLLTKRGLFDKRIVDSLGAEKYTKLISEDDWLNIFKISDKSKVNDEDLFQKVQNKLLDLKADELIYKIKMLFSNLNYSEIKYEKYNENSFYYILTGAHTKQNKIISAVAFCQLTKDNLSENEIIEVIENFEKEKKYDKIFFITLGKEISMAVKLDKNVIVLSGEELAKYLALFRLL